MTKDRKATMARIVVEGCRRTVTSTKMDRPFVLVLTIAPGEDLAGRRSDRTSDQELERGGHGAPRDGGRTDWTGDQELERGGFENCAVLAGELETLAVFEGVFEGDQQMRSWGRS